MKRARSLILPVAFGLVVAACAGEQTQGTSAPASSIAPDTADTTVGASTTSDSGPVAVVVAGGTIVKGYGASTLVGATDIEAWPVSDMPLSVRVRWVSDAPSPALSLADTVELASELVEAARAIGSTKVVVLTGTDAMEEVAFALDLLVPPEFTVVCTGAMQSPQAAGFDGATNLNAALAFLNNIGDASGRTFVALAGVVLGALGATKVESKSFDSYAAPFVDPWKGPAAEVDHSLQVSHHHVGYERSANLVVAPGYGEPTVPIISAGLGEMGDWLGMLSTNAIDGLVVSALGSGNTHPRLLANAEPFLRRGKPVMVSSRCLMGSAQPVYEYPCGGR